MASDSVQNVGVEDVAGVRSRVSWGAILGGSVVAAALYLVLTFFFAAIGLSLTESGISRGTGLGAAAAAALVTIFVSLFVGGWVTAQLTAGETQHEAMIYGVLTWAVVTAFSLGLVGMGVRAGYFALVSGALVAQNSPAAQQSWEDAARRMGVKDETLAKWKHDLDPEKVKAEANDPANQDKAQAMAAGVAWASFAGTLLSVAAAVGGAVVGAGPSFRLFPSAAVARRTVVLAR